MSDSNDSEDEFFYDGSSQSGATVVVDSYGNSIISTDKRAHHNALERKRRDHIKDSFSLLRSVIPTLRKEKASRATVLKKAAGYIQFMKQRNKDHEKEIEQIRTQNKVIEDKIAELERAPLNTTVVLRPYGDTQRPEESTSAVTTDLIDSDGIAEVHRVPPENQQFRADIRSERMSPLQVQNLMLGAGFFVPADGKHK